MMNRVLKTVNMHKQIYKLTIIKRFHLRNSVKIEKITIFITHPIPNITELTLFKIICNRSFVDDTFQANWF